jgi:hypothetical protein
VSILAEALRARGGALTDALVEAPDGTSTGVPGPAQLAARGPRAAGHEEEYELLLEMIVEGSRLHYGTGREVQTNDRDLALLLGDQLYALGLERLSALADLFAVAELADVISLVSQAYATGDAELAEAVWRAGAVAIGWGSSAAHEEAKRLARAGDERALRALAVAADRANASDARSDVDDKVLGPFN